MIITHPTTRRCHDVRCEVRVHCDRWQQRAVGGPHVTHAMTLRAAWQMHDEPCEHAIMTMTDDLFAEIDPPEDQPMAEFMHCGSNFDYAYAMYLCKAGHQKRVVADHDAPIDVDSLPEQIVCEECLEELQRKRGKK